MRLFWGRDLEGGMASWPRTRLVRPAGRRRPAGLQVARRSSGLAVDGRGARVTSGGAVRASERRGAVRFDYPEDYIEDGYVWREDGLFHLLMKDMTGGILGEPGGGAYATSDDGVQWTMAKPAGAYSLTIAFSDGSRRDFARAERPQLLVEDGHARMLYLALARTAGGRWIVRTWNQAIPLAG